MRALILLSILPCLASAQDPGAEYLRLIRADTSFQNPDRHTWKRLVFTPGNQIRQIRQTDSTLEILRTQSTQLSLRGNYVFSAGLRRPGKLPELQNTWAQGQSSGGTLRWQGAESGETFSYGPALSALEYDGLSYPYDRNGRLVPKGTGNGQPAQPYDNGIFRTGSMTMHQLSLEARLSRNRAGNAGIRLEAERQDEALTIMHNRNRREKFTGAVSYRYYNWEFEAGYLHTVARFSNPDRNGFLQNVYRLSLLTPATFDGQYSQQSFGNGMDNPLRLLDGNGQLARRERNQVRGKISYQNSRLYIWTGHAIHTAGGEEQWQFRPGGSVHPAGYAQLRSQRDRSWQSHVGTEYQPLASQHPLQIKLGLDYIFDGDKTDIDFRGTDPARHYNYQRSSHRLSASSMFRWQGHESAGGVHGGVGMYHSNTIARSVPLLPWVKLFGEWKPDGVRFEGWVTWRHDATEPAPGESLAAAELLNLDSHASEGYLARMEVPSFHGQTAIRRQDLNAELSAVIHDRYSILVSLYQRETIGDLAALPAGGIIELQRVGDHIREGLEIQVGYNKHRYHRLAGVDIATFHTVTFHTWQHLATKVYPGREALPVAGFKDVYKVFVEGWPVDAIAGSYWLRNGANQMVIGADGFPLRAAGTRIIANAKPDFVFTMNNGVRWKALKLETTLEWQKGGDVWNGTAAALDYYGRSAASGKQRTVDDYVFPGVSLSGHPNTQAVRFYDPAQPVTANRWVRYGPVGVAEDYIERNDFLNLRRISLGYDYKMKKWLNKVGLVAYAENIFLWQAYSGAAPGLQLFDQPQFNGLDYFRLPASSQYGVSLHLQF